jgi:methylmalonyl-CoA/ethylmalonyl-CoA epimerase
MMVSIFFFADSDTNSIGYVLVKQIYTNNDSFAVIKDNLTMVKIEHIGIAVKDLETSNRLFAKLLGKAHYKVESVESENVNTSFFQIGDSKIELLQATSDESAIAKYLEKKGEGVHHLAFAVEDIEKEVERLKAEGFQAISDKPKRGADNKLVFFFHPKSTNGILIELCQEINE